MLPQDKLSTGATSCNIQQLTMFVITAGTTTSNTLLLGNNTNLAIDRIITEYVIRTERFDRYSCNNTLGVWCHPLIYLI